MRYMQKNCFNKTISDRENYFDCPKEGDRFWNPMKELRIGYDIGRSSNIANPSDTEQLINHLLWKSSFSKL